MVSNHAQERGGIDGLLLERSVHDIPPQPKSSALTGFAHTQKKDFFDIWLHLVMLMLQTWAIHCWWIHFLLVNLLCFSSAPFVLEFSGSKNYVVGLCGTYDAWDTSRNSHTKLPGRGHGRPGSGGMSGLNKKTLEQSCGMSSRGEAVSKEFESLGSRVKQTRIFHLVSAVSLISLSLSVLSWKMGIKISPSLVCYSV